MSLQNAAARVGASRRSSEVSRSYQFPRLMFVLRSGNDGRLRVVPWGASMSLHLVSCVPIIYLCLRSCAPVSGAYSFPYTS